MTSVTIFFSTNCPSVLSEEAAGNIVDSEIPATAPAGPRASLVRKLVPVRTVAASSTSQ
jgi:hypothetical protein